MESVTKTTKTTTVIFVEEVSDTEKSKSASNARSFQDLTQKSSPEGSTPKSPHPSPMHDQPKPNGSSPRRTPNFNIGIDQTLRAGHKSIEDFIGQNLTFMSDCQNLLDGNLANPDSGDFAPDRQKPNFSHERPKSSISPSMDTDPFLIAQHLASKRPLTPELFQRQKESENVSSARHPSTTGLANGESASGITPIDCDASQEPGLTADSDFLPTEFSTETSDIFATTTSSVIQEEDETKPEGKASKFDNLQRTSTSSTLTGINHAFERNESGPINMASVVEGVTSTNLHRRRTGPLKRTSSKLDVLRGQGNRGTKLNKAIHNLDDFKTIEDSLMYHTMKPLLTCMKFSGIFFMKKKGTFGKTFVGRIRSMSPLQMYCVFTSFVLFANFVRTIPIFDGSEGFDSIFFFKLLSIIFAYEALSRAMLNYYGCSLDKKGYQHLFLSLDNVCYPDGIIPYEEQLKKVMKSLIAASIIISLANVGMTAVGMFFDHEMFDVLLVPVPRDLPGIVYFKIFLLVMMFINAYIAMFSLSFFTTICYGLYKEFEYFARTFLMKIKDDGQFVDDLEKFRIMHQRRCTLVQDADRSFKYYIANTYATNVPLLCLLLYNLVYDESNSISYRFINTFRILYVFLQMMVVSVAATLINNQAHAPLASMYSIRVQKASAERQMEMNMFLNKLTGTLIGLTAWDMFVINKPAILTVIGMILTYFFLIVQVKNPMLGNSAVCICNFNTSHLPTDTFGLMPNTSFS